jgi:hypothetical protein
MDAAAGFDLGKYASIFDLPQKIGLKFLQQVAVAKHERDEIAYITDVDGTERAKWNHSPYFKQLKELHGCDFRSHPDFIGCDDDCGSAWLAGIIRQRHQMYTRELYNKRMEADMKLWEKRQAEERKAADAAWVVKQERERLIVQGKLVDNDNEEVKLKKTRVKRT